MWFKKIKKSKFGKIYHGIISGASGNDPAGITTYSIVGAATGFTQLFLVPISTIFLITVQSICARIGDVKKKGLTAVIKERFGNKVAFIAIFLLVLANLTTMGADLSAVGVAFRILFPKLEAFLILPLISFFVWYIVVFKNYRFISKFLIFLSLIFVCYIFSGFAVRPNWAEIFSNTFWPKISFSPYYWLIAVGFLGTTLSPYMFFWQTAEEVEDKPSIRDIKKEVSENAPGLIFSNLIAYFIIICTASVLFVKKIEITSATEAALALKPFLGQYAFGLFALGIIGAGLLALPVLASCTAYALAEIFNWREGLSEKVHSAKGFYTVLSATFFIALAISLLGLNPIKVLFYSQIFNGFLTPIILALIMIIASSRRIMGKYINTWGINVLGWLAILVMVLAIVASFVVS